MALKANYEFLFIGKDENSFLESYSYDLFQDYGEKSGEIFVTLEVQNNPLNAEDIGAGIFETMQKVFFEDVSREPYERFEIALKAVNKLLNDFRSQKASQYIGNLNIIIAAIVEGNLFLSQCGDSEAYLIRKRYVSIISEGLSEESGGDTFVNIANGKIEEGDFVIFSTTRLVRYLSKNDLAAAVGRKSVMEALEEVKDVISTEMLGRVGLTGMVFSTATQSELSEVDQELDSMNTSILEATEEKVTKERQSLTGKFFTAIKGLARRRGLAQSYEPAIPSSSGGRFMSSAKERVGRLFGGLGSKGFGKDKILIALILVIVVLAVGIWIARENSLEQAEMERLDTVLSRVQENLRDAEVKGTYDKEAAKTLLDRAYTDAIGVLNSGEYRAKANELLAQVETARDKIDNVKRVESPKVYADLKTKRADVNALGFVEVANRKFVFEADGLYEIVLNQVQDPLTIDDKETVVAATGFDDRNSVVFLTKSGKLIEYREGTMSLMDTEEGSFHKGVALDDWSNRIYMLDPATNQIWKYTYKGTQEKFGTAEGYMAKETDLSKTVDLAIDSNVYVLKTSGEIMKFLSGNAANFKVQNAPLNPLTSPAKVYTNEKLNQVFVLDNKGKRVVVFNKDSKSGNLVYDHQYLISASGEFRDFYVDPQAKKIYVLTESRVYEVDL